MPLSRRVPKRGFCNVFKKRFAIVNIEALDRFSDNEIITPERLLEEGMIKKVMSGVKILSRGNIKKSLTVRAHFFSQAAIRKIRSAGGKVEVI